MNIFSLLFGNKDDGLYGDLGFNPTGEKSLWMAIKWWLKNPAHNLTFYQIGVADQKITRTGKYPKDVFSPVGGLNYSLTKLETPEGICKTLFETFLALNLSILSTFLFLQFAWWGMILAFVPLIWVYASVFKEADFMPFISYHANHFRAYIGWRERGNFGLKLNISIKGYV